MALMRIAAAWFALAIVAHAQNGEFENLRAEAERHRALATTDRQKAVVIEQRIPSAVERVTRLTAEKTRLDARFKLKAGSERSSEVFIAALARYRRQRAAIEKRELPALYEDLGHWQSGLAEVIDRQWELETSLAELDESERTKAMREVLLALRERANAMEQAERALTQLEGRALEAAKALDELTSLVLGRSYWLRTDPPLGLTTLQRAASETRSSWTTLRRVSWGGGARAVLVLAALIGLVGLLAWRLTRHRKRWAYRGTPFWQGLQRTVVSLLFAVAAPVALWVGSSALGPLGFAPEWTQAAKTALELAALVVAVRAIAWRIFRRKGVAVGEWGMDEAAARQLLRAVQIGTMAAFLFLVPAETLREPPLLLSQVPRLLFTLYLIGVGIAVISLLPRRGAIIRAWTGGAGPFHRIWFVVGPALMAGVVGIAAMHMMGYRLGARMLLQNTLATVALVLVLAGLHAALVRLVDHLAGRVRRRALEEAAGRAAAREQSAEVVHQLTRVVVAAVLLVAFLWFAGVWGLDDALRSAANGVHLASFSGGVVITLWDVGKALLWIFGGHFFVSNLSAAYSYLVMPLTGKDDAGGRFVFIALARYLILIVSYTAAVLALHFSFASVGWAFAAASVGIGFGLQEIVANFISGIIILLERPIRIGDIITVGTTGGTVDKITIRATHVVNWDRQMIVVPNKQFITEEVTNWTRNDHVMRRKITVGVKYGSDIEKVFRALRETVDAHPAVVKVPESRIWFESFGDSSLNFEIWFFADISAGREAQSELRAAIDARFRADGIEIPFPQRDLHVRTVDQEILDQRKPARDEEAPGAERGE